MCSRKCFRMPTLVILGVIVTIVLVCITGITLTNSINISNIVKLREKVASDSAAASGATAAQTRAALVEQQYSTLQQHHLSRSDLNYIAATHPKNLQRFNSPATVGGVGGGGGSGGNQVNAPAPHTPQNKIIIEIGIRNFSEATAPASGSGAGSGAGVGVSGLGFAASGTLDSFDRLVAPITGAIVDGNIDSISVPASDLSELRALNESLARIAKAKGRARTGQPDHPPSTTTPATTTASIDPPDPATDRGSVAASTIADRLSIEDHNPAQIDFEKRNHVKKIL